MAKRASKRSATGKLSVAQAGYTTEENLRRLGESGILDDFLVRTGSSWDHQAWLGLCAEIEAKGYAPIDFDHVGLMLEAKRARGTGNCDY
jgi:hypothetical protein